MFSLKNKTAIVTGACGLLGENHCHALAEAGANVVVADLNANKCETLVKNLQGDHLACVLDVTDKKSIEQVRDRVVEKYNSIDILVNNAAINDMFENPEMAGELSKFENYPIDSWKKSLEVNVTGMFLCSQVFGTVMAANGNGSIINVASTYGIVGPDQNIYKNEEGIQEFYKSAAYPTTKGAVLNFTRYLAAYWGKKGIRVNSLSPGGVENGQDSYFIKNYSNKTALGRMATPTDYKGAVVFLASDASAYMTGANLIVDGGWTAM